MFGAVPFIIKHHGSVKYVKYLITSFRCNGKKSSPPNKIFAASAFPNATSKPKNELGKNSKKEPSHNEYDHDFNKASQASLRKCTIQEQSASPSSTNEVLEKYFRPVLKPDITNIALNSDQKASNEKSDKSVKLLNSLKPSDLEWTKQSLDIYALPQYYKSLSKFRLTGLVVITTLAGYCMSPGVIEIGPLLCLILGTGFTSAAANSINQFLEVPYDSQMSRTKNRVLTRGLLTPLHAFTFAACSAGTGLSLLYFGTNSITACLGVTNLLLYTSVYTPLKRCSIANTWLGSIVGAIPPVMGWSASTGSIDAGALLLGALLYAWQFPHFNALSWNLRSDYSKAGYRMTSVIDPDLCRRTALRYSILMLALCTSAPLLDLTTWTFAFDSLPLNLYLIYCSWQFYKKGDASSSRKLFRLSLIYLPIIMLLMFVGKKYANQDSKCLVS